MNTELINIKLKDLKTIFQEFCERKNLKWDDVEWIGASDASYVLSPSQFMQLGSYYIRGIFDIAEHLTIAFKDGSAYSFFPEENSENILQSENWVPMIAPIKNESTLTPYTLFDLNNFRPVPPINYINGDPIRLKIFMLNLDLVKLWNTLIEHNFVFNVITDEMLNPVMKGAIHTKAFDGVKIGDILLRIYIKGITDYISSPERSVVIQYIEEVLKLNSNFFKFEDVPVASSILIFFKPLGTQ